jgi:hypothetical protein
VSRLDAACHASSDRCTAFQRTKFDAVPKSVGLFRVFRGSERTV